MEKNQTYTVAVRSWTYEDYPEYTCGHAHKTVAAAETCGTRLYAAKTVNGSWQAADGFCWYVTEVRG